MCELLGLDPAVYFTETDRRKQAYRDAAATVIHSNRQRQAAAREAEAAAKRHRNQIRQ